MTKVGWKRRFDYEKCQSVAFALKDGPSLIHEVLMAAMFDATIS